MTKATNRVTLIKKFLDRTLNEEELASFKKKWEADPDFVQEVRDYAHLAVALKASADLRRQGEGSEAKVRQLDPRVRWAAVAAVALLVVTPLYLTLRAPSAQELAQRHIIDTRLHSFRGAEDTDGSPFEEAIRAYSKGKRQEAIALMRQVEERESARYLFAMGDLFLEVAQPDSALYYYNRGKAFDPDDPYMRWNSIIAYLQKGEVANAKVQLEQLVVSGEPPYDQRARKLLEELDAPGFRIRSWLE